jgi:hypothetical protein
VQSNEAALLREEQISVNELRNELTKLRSAQQSSKVVAGRVEELEALVEQLKAELDSEKKDKERVITDRENIRHEKDEVCPFFSLFNCSVFSVSINKTALLIRSLANKNTIFMGLNLSLTFQNEHYDCVSIVQQGPLTLHVSAETIRVAE